MADLKLYTQEGSFRAFKILIAAKYAGVEVEVPKFNVGVDNKTDEYLAKNPMGKIPTLETPEGCIFESNAIARYIARMRPDKNLYGKSFFESGQIDSWVDFCSHEVELPATMWVYPILGYLPPHDVATAKATEDCKAALALLENHLKFRTFMVGNCVTLADLAIFSALWLPFKFVMDAKFRKPYGNVERWFITIANQAEVLSVIGPVELCKKSLGAAAAPAAGKKAAGKKDKKKAAKKAPVEEKKVEGPPAVKDIMAKLPKSALVIDEWKRTYSGVGRTEESQAVAFDWLMANMDWSGYCFYTQEYSYNSENKKGWMTSNAVKGFQQRTEEMRKFAFGIMHILGDEETATQFNVNGVWLLRGQDMDCFIQSNDECEYYKWTKIDQTDAAGMAMVKDRLVKGWTADQSLEGIKIYETFEFK